MSSWASAISAFSNVTCNGMFLSCCGAFVGIRFTSYILRGIELWRQVRPVVHPVGLCPCRRRAQSAKPILKFGRRTPRQDRRVLSFIRRVRRQFVGPPAAAHERKPRALVQPSQAVPARPPITMYASPASAISRVVEGHGPVSPKLEVIGPRGLRTVRLCGGCLGEGTHLTLCRARILSM